MIRLGHSVVCHRAARVSQRAVLLSLQQQPSLVASTPTITDFTQQQQDKKQQRWKATATRPDSTKHLQMVSSAIQKVLEEKTAPGVAGNETASISEEKSGHVERVEKAWQLFENTLENATACVNDIASNETPEHFETEIETAELAITEAQAALLDVLEVAREKEVSLSPEQEEEAGSIRKLRQRLDNLLEEKEDLKQA